jgi:hypothetical protein
VAGQKIRRLGVFPSHQDIAPSGKILVLYAAAAIYEMASNLMG